jgi:hypothetical protein
MQPTLLHGHLYPHLVTSSHHFMTPVVRPLPRPVEQKNLTRGW